MAEAKHYFWDDPYLCNVCGYDVVRCYVPHEEVSSILQHCHCMKAGGHHGPTRTAHKVLQYGFFWPTLYRDANEHVRSCDSCQRIGALSRRFKMPQNNMLLVELFDVWGIDFMVPFPKYFRCKYILVVVDYMSKWVEAVALPTNGARSVTKFLKKNIFTCFGTPWAIISDGGIHFCNKFFYSLLAKYGVTHKVTAPYHPQTNGQVEMSNMEPKRILEKIISASQKD